MTFEPADTTRTADETHGHPGDGAVHAHVSPVRQLVLVFAALIMLTVLTVAVTFVDVGALNIWLAMLIAAGKAALVALFFMHLRWENPFFGQILITSFFFVALFIGIALIDTKEYAETLTPAAETQAMPQR